MSNFSVSNTHVALLSSTVLLIPPGRPRNKPDATEATDDPPGLLAIAVLNSLTMTVTKSLGPLSVSAVIELLKNILAMSEALCRTLSKLSVACFKAVPDSPTKSVILAPPIILYSPRSISTNMTSFNDSFNSC